MCKFSLNMYISVRLSNEQVRHHLITYCGKLQQRMHLQMHAYLRLSEVHTRPHSTLASQLHTALNKCNIQEEKSTSNDPSIPIGLVRGDLLTGRVNSRLIHCQHNPRGSLLENLVLWCQVTPHNSPVGLLSVMSRAQCGCVAAERPVITAAPCGKAARSNPNKIPSDN